MELAKVLAEAISSNSNVIDQAARRWPDRPIQVEMSWHPAMRKLDIRLLAVDQLPPYRPKYDEAALTLVVKADDLASE